MMLNEIFQQLNATARKLVLGYPKDAPKMKYLEKLAQRHGTPVFGDLESTMAAAVAATRLPFGASTR